MKIRGIIKSRQENKQSFPDTYQSTAYTGSLLQKTDNVSLRHSSSLLGRITNDTRTQKRQT